MDLIGLDGARQIRNQKSGRRRGLVICDLGGDGIRIDS